MTNNSIIGDKYIPDINKPDATTLGDKLELNEASKMAMDQVSADWDSIRTAQKDKFVTDHKVKLTDEDLTIFSRPRKGCAHCYGKGVEGYYSEDSTKLPGQPALCRCLTNKLIYHPEAADTNNCLTYGEFKELMRLARLRYNLKEPIDEQTTKMDANSSKGSIQETSISGDERPTGTDNRQVIGQDSVA